MIVITEKPKLTGRCIVSQNVCRKEVGDRAGPDKTGHDVSSDVFTLNIIICILF